MLDLIGTAISLIMITLAAISLCRKKSVKNPKNSLSFPY